MFADTGKTGQNATSPREGAFSGMTRNGLLPAIGVTLGVIAAIEILSSTVFYIPNASIVCLLAVVYAAYSGGIGAGLVSAALALIYVTWSWSLPGALFHYSPFDFNRVMVLLIVAPAMALMVGALRRRSRFYEETAIANAALQAQIAERKETHDALKHAEDERLAHALKQRDTLVREVHHRVKNNLQTVAGLLMHETYDHPELQPLLLKAIAQVQLIAVAHGIQGAAKAQEIPLCEMVSAIARIVESLTQSRIQIDVDIDMTRPAQICEKESVPIALILNELLFNATKHSPRDAQPGKIKVTIRRDGNNVEIRIFNPGSLPPGFNFAAGIATGTGLGLVGSLMPRQGATIFFRGLSDGVETALKLSPPVIDV